MRLVLFLKPLLCIEPTRIISGDSIPLPQAPPYLYWIFVSTTWSCTRGENVCSWSVEAGCAGLGARGTHSELRAVPSHGHQHHLHPQLAV